MSKPATIPVWATNANYSTGDYAGTPTCVAPSAGVRADGHIPDTAPGSQHENYDRNLIGEWLTYLDGLPGETDFTSERFDWTGEHHHTENVFLNGGFIQWESLPSGDVDLVSLRYFSGIDCCYDPAEFDKFGTDLQVASGSVGGTALWPLNGRLGNGCGLSDAGIVYTWSAGSGTADFILTSTLPDGTDVQIHESVAMTHGGSPKTFAISPGVLATFNTRLYYLGLSVASPSGENLKIKSVYINAIPIYLIP